MLTNRYPGFTPEQLKKSFHADTYCFDSIPEKECFMQYITSGKVAEVYFTGMFTSNQGDLSVHYYDPRVRQNSSILSRLLCEDGRQLLSAD